MPSSRALGALFGVLLLPAMASLSAAQEPEVSPPSPHQHGHDAGTALPPSWSWMADANVFFGYNYQQREFTDHSVWESQNWFMLHGTRPLGAGQLQFEGMLSLEPLTMRGIGSPQLFQTGESYRMGPLIDRQHPHDLFMELGGVYRQRRGRAGVILAAYLVGPAALGPTPFMYRESGRNNPQSPLAHHQLDSTHITPGVLTAGVELGRLTFLGSWFRGEEPDEHRLDIAPPWLDSWSVQGKWQQGPWLAQVSGGVLHHPAWFEPYDIPRFTASIEFNGAVRAHPVAVTIAWGKNREIHGPLDGYMLEWDTPVAARAHFYGRADAGAKDILDLGFPDPPGFVSFHRISHVAAGTFGYVYDFLSRPWGRLGVGGDATLYHVPENMRPYYGTSPHSYHVFVRYRRQPRDSMNHRH